MQSSLWIMTPDIWEQVKGKLMNAGDLPEEEYFDIEYHYILSAEQVEIDKTGRITIPPAHRRYAGLNRDCLVLSAMNRLEIWDENFFYAYLKERRPKIHETVKKMGALGLFRTEGRGPETGD
jgi:MraZ protein